MIAPAARRGRSRSEAGFTLIELMVALVVSAIVVLGIFAFSSIQQSTAAMHQRNVRVQQALEGAMWSIAGDMRQAGLGFARHCSELRVWDGGTGRLINPGGGADPATAAIDPVTNEAYWVLRDGIQAHWNSSGATTFDGGLASSAASGSAADSFDVMLADSAYLNTYGVFQLVQPIDGATDYVLVETSALLDNTNPDHLAQVQQLFPPGTFFITARGTPTGGGNPMRPESLGQCALLQITGDVEAEPGDAQQWRLPVSGALSGFNADLTGLMADNNGVINETPTCPADVQSCDDWDPDTDNAAGVSIVPLGRLRWSRYEIDYTVATTPYLVRYDVIGYQDGIDQGNLGGATDYPFCDGGQCTAPGLHLPGSNSPPVAVAIGPMIEDLQVSVGCDGYTAAAAAAAPMGIVPPPDPGYEEVGPAAGPTANVPNLTIDENPFGQQRDRDEWIGNAVNEQTAPDCVWHGTAEYNRDLWIAQEGDSNPPPPFRMSPQTIRITLVGSGEFPEEAGGLAALPVLAVEDRVPIDSQVGVRQRFTLTERFSPENLRWRDPSIP
jgi:prepilin-type N-terminal cleavage/methylation domain-containing protein